MRMSFVNWTVGSGRGGEGLIKEMFHCRVWGCWCIRRRHDDIRCEEVGIDQTMSRKWFVS